MKLCGDESKCGSVVFAVTKDWHIAVKVGDSVIGAAKTQHGADDSGTTGEKGPAQLGHDWTPRATQNPILAPHRI